MKWNVDNEKRLMEMKEQGYTNEQISEELGTTPSSVKHKYTRLKQNGNADSHHHPIEKTQQVKRILDDIDADIFVLETHAGYGNLTEVYSLYAKEVVAYEIDKKKWEHINQIGHDNVVCLKTDSLKEMHLSIYHNLKFNVIDIDPYGFPSRYFPSVFELIDDGYMFITFPKYGCTQINKVTMHHVNSFYGFEGGKNEEFLECCINTLKNQALQTYRRLEVLDVLDLKKVYRVAIRIKKENAFVMCGYEHLTKKGKGA